jgi:hypothetical protein
METVGRFVFFAGLICSLIFGRVAAACYNKSLLTTTTWWRVSIAAAALAALGGAVWVLAA